MSRATWGARVARLFLFLIGYGLVAFFVLLKIPMQSVALRAFITFVVVIVGGFIGWSWGLRSRS